jgi:hydrogenase maturation protein HypF
MIETSCMISGTSSPEKRRRAHLLLTIPVQRLATDGYGPGWIQGSISWQMKTSTVNPAAGNARLKLAVRGAVQGVGFRPFVFRLATELGLAGGVNNSPQGVFIEAEGPRAALENFLLRLETEKPVRSFIQSLESSWLDAVGFKQFEIRGSAAGGGKTALVLPDIATCPECLREILDPANRRYRYPFTNCTNCGPRFSIIEALPYDRASTSMKSFTMCPQCQAEYDDPRDRRFHAQPNACPACGPRLELLECGDMSPISKRGHVRALQNNDALLAAAHAIRAGKIAAVKGVGGFHLMADARNEQAVQRLRERKHREEKPFALMFPTLESVKAVCEVSPLEERLLRSPEAPIVLVCRDRRAIPTDEKCQRMENSKAESVGTFHPLAPSVAPGNPNLGVMLPSNPLQHLLMAELGFPVIATSGNLSDEPMCTDESEALERLGDIADVFLVHNRPIVRHVDDSIARVMLDREMVLRRARGYAPLPITLNPQPSTFNSQPILAVGAHLKNTIALAVGDQVFISQHIGDLETEPAHNAFRRVIADFEKLYDAKPELVAADLHPDYLSTRFADEIGRAGLPPGQDAQQRVPTKVGVQHHIAHVLSCMAENEIGPPALGVSWDGTGYGLDGTIWGGEFFQVADDEVKRIAHLRPFRLPGGDKAVREPRRPAIGLLYELFGEAAFDMKHLAPFQDVPAVELSALKGMLRRQLNSPQTSSIGRLFDAVASLAGLRQQMRYEGQAAMELEFALDGIEIDEGYNLSLVTRHSSLVLDWSPMIEAILSDVQNGVAVSMISAKFHNALAEAVVTVARQTGQRRVVLSGGCFQNRYLTERTVRRLQAERFQPCWHQRVPPNDGGIALGQVVAARFSLECGDTSPLSSTRRVASNQSADMSAHSKMTEQIVNRKS